MTVDHHICHLSRTAIEALTAADSGPSGGGAEESQIGSAHLLSQSFISLFQFSVLATKVGWQSCLTGSCEGVTGIQKAEAEGALLCALPLPIARLCLPMSPLSLFLERQCYHNLIM